MASNKRLQQRAIAQNDARDAACSNYKCQPVWRLSRDELAVTAAYTARTSHESMMPVAGVSQLKRTQRTAGVGSVHGQPKQRVDGDWRRGWLTNGRARDGRRLPQRRGLVRSTASHRPLQEGSLKEVSASSSDVRFGTRILASKFPIRTAALPSANLPKTRSATLHTQ